jgi:hypothetical protein
VITHVVCFRLKDRSPEGARKVCQALEGLRGKVPVLRFLSVGADLVRSARSYDVALVAKFDSLADLEAYQLHPAHQEVVRFLDTVREGTVAVDYESD